MQTKGFRSDALERMTEKLTESGHLDMNDPLDEEAILIRVLGACNDSVKQGVIAASEVRVQCSKFWKLSLRRTVEKPLDDADIELPPNDDA